MALVGYARVSTLGQSLEVQLQKLEAAGVDKVFEEKKSGVDANRPALKQCLDYLRQGDTLLISRIDRLARSAEDLLRIVRELEEKQVTIKVLDQSIDTRDAAGKAFLGMLAVFAEFETNIRKERQMDGIAKAKAKGTKFGRKKALTAEVISSIKSMRVDEERTIPEIMAKTGLSKATVYRALSAS
ncbi:recombinase family protein [Roseibium denhamense]|uniref:Site-specific DNA recombinase n=1 Tax=Roseibium denhamense TaxID=76305 RepID=A0ABY1PAX3_9HYPH|nr:recombinase family protein [Roseibium denhamense]MTI07459.1 recombinase family protein [Roseibium denhamense]SMP29912.1 Site-specific DNA recombinase [Roseibium denhamense]